MQEFAYTTLIGIINEVSVNKQFQNSESKRRTERNLELRNAVRRTSL
jgi:hypothetical protein